MWSSVIDGKVLHFHLYGINNENFLMKDEETGSVWQQASGKAVFGKLSGRSLSPIYWDELTFAQWRSENPGARLLAPDPKILTSGHYAKPDWEKHINAYPVVTPADKILPQREIVLGIENAGMSKAYPLKALTPDTPIQDQVGPLSIFLCMAADGKSVRCFDRTLDVQRFDFFARSDANVIHFVDSISGSEWGFDGVAFSGPSSGRRLKRIPVLKDFWFDWKIYHPQTLLYRR